MLGIMTIPVEVEESRWASQRRWNWSPPLKDGDDLDVWCCGGAGMQVEEIA